MRIDGNTPIDFLMHSDTTFTAKDAYKIFVHEHEDLSVLDCYDYDSCFVFQAVTSEYANSPLANTVFDSLYSIDKKTRKISMFKPFNISVSEYNRGKRITNFRF